MLSCSTQRSHRETTRRATRRRRGVRACWLAGLCSPRLVATLPVGCSTRRTSVPLPRVSQRRCARRAGALRVVQLVAAHLRFDPPAGDGARSSGSGGTTASHRKLLCHRRRVELGPVPVRFDFGNAMPPVDPLLKVVVNTVPRRALSTHLSGDQPTMIDPVCGMTVRDDDSTAVSAYLMAPDIGSALLSAGTSFWPATYLDEAQGRRNELTENGWGTGR